MHTACSLLYGGEGGLCLGGSLSRGVSVQVVFVQGGSLSRGSLCPEGVLSPGRSLSRGGSLSREVSVWGVSVQGNLCPGGVICPEEGLPEKDTPPPPPVNRITDRCKNITFVAGGKNLSIITLFWRSTKIKGHWRSSALRLAPSQLWVFFRKSYFSK